jgi:hypothetical protein
MPVSLDDDQLAIVMAAAQPLSPKTRDAFSISVASELGKHRELGAGLVARIVRDQQRRYFAPPRYADALSAPRAGRVHAR